MPILKYTMFVGASLLAIIVVAEQFVKTAPVAAAPKEQSSASSLELLRKMANHGEVRPFASAAAAGPFVAMPAVATPKIVAAAITPPEPVKPEALKPPTAVKQPPAPVAVQASILDAQARLDERRVIEKPARRAKKVASHKPKPRFVYVENISREPSGFFGAFQSW